MQSRQKQNPTDVMFLIESSSMIGVCFDLILENHIKPLLHFFYDMPITEDLGISKDLRRDVFSAISYKDIASTPNSICKIINPISNAKHFLEKIENGIEFCCHDEGFHLAEAIAMCLEIFEDLDKKRDKQQIDRHSQKRHIVLIACQKPFDDIPIFESNIYKGLKLDEILQNLLKFKVNLSIISPKFSNDWINLFGRINGSSCECFVKLDKLGNFNFLALLHNSIHLIDYEAQQKQKLNQQQLIQQQAQQQIQITAQPPSVSSVQEQFQTAQESVPSPAINQIGYQQAAAQISQSSASQVQGIQSQQTTQQQYIGHKVLHQQAPQTGQSSAQIQQNFSQNLNNIQQQSQQIQSQQEMFSQQQIISQPSPGQPSLMPRSTSNIGKQASMQQTNQQAQQAISGQGIRPQVVQVQPIVRMGQPQGQQPVIMPGYEQMQQQPRFQAAVQQQQQQFQQSMQNEFTNVWEGSIEWYQKVANDKILHSLRAKMLSKNVVEPTTRQVVPEVPLAQTKMWPPRIPLQLLSRQIFEILNGFCQSPTADLYLVPEERSQDLKQTLSSGAALINLASLNLEIKILIATVQNDQIVCKIPSDQAKALNILKEIVKRQKQQQQQQQQQQSQRMPQTAQGLNVHMIQPGQVIIQSGQPSQIIGHQVQAQSWLNQPQQQQQQQQSQQMYMQQQTQQQQTQQQSYQQYKPF